MTSALFITVDAGGNVPPALAIARRIQAYGGQVRVLAPAALRTAVQTAGLSFEASPNAQQWDPVQHHRTLASLRGLLRACFDRGLAGDLVASAQRDPVDVVVVDCMLLPVLAASVDAGLKTVPLVHSLPQYFAGPWSRGPMGVVGTVRRLRPQAVWGRCGGAIVTALPSLAQPFGHGSVCVGPIWVHDADSPGQTSPTERGSAEPGPEVGRGRPRLLVSLSTNWFPGMDQALQNILDAVGRVDADVIVTTGPAIDPASLRAPSNAKLIQFADHNVVMPTVDLVLGHGGHGTTMRALAHGLPLAIMPMHPLLDQPMVGSAVQQAGAGELLKRTAPPAQITAVLTAMLTQTRYQAYRSAAQRLQAEILRHNAPAEAAAYLATIAAQPASETAS